MQVHFKCTTIIECLSCLWEQPSPIIGLFTLLTRNSKSGPPFCTSNGDDLFSSCDPINISERNYGNSVSMSSFGAFADKSMRCFDTSHKINWNLFLRKLHSKTWIECTLLTCLWGIVKHLKTQCFETTLNKFVRKCTCGTGFRVACFTQSQSKQWYYLLELPH